MLDRPHEVPDSFGVYIFKNENGDPIYIGKAKSLKKRVASYFLSNISSEKTKEMLSNASDLEWITLTSETEALLLENSLIKKYQPRYNVMLRDDKSYPWVAVDLKQEYPRAVIYRGPRRKNVTYFGPYAKVYDLRNALETLSTIFPIRSCSDAKYKQHQIMGRPCLLYDIKRCSGPCINAVSRDEYMKYLESTIDVLSGNVDPIIEDFKQQMQESSRYLNYEHAAIMRDRLKALHSISQIQQVVIDSDQNLDVIGISRKSGLGCVENFHVRHGRLVGRNTYYFEHANDLGDLDMAELALKHIYLNNRGIEDNIKIVLRDKPASFKALVDAIKSANNLSKVSVMTARGTRLKALIDMAEENAAGQLRVYFSERRRTFEQRSQMLGNLAEKLGLKAPPYRIECYDCSHLSGRFYVGSMSVVKDALVSKNDGRIFKLSLEQNDDYKAMGELLTRRIERLDDKKFGARPDLIVIDGGIGQLNVVKKIFDFYGITDIGLCAIAKENEDIYVAGKSEAVLSSSPDTFILQLARDEAHRLAVSYNRRLRIKNQKENSLKAIKGVGEVINKKLMSEFKTVSAIRDSTPEEIAAKASIPRQLADRIFNYLNKNE
jgi:excinuclease ABC subunit C